MNFWLESHFEREIRTAFGTQGQKVWEKLKKIRNYVKDPKCATPDPTHKEMFKVNGALPVCKCNIDAGSRLFYTQLDEALIRKLPVLGSEDGNVSPSGGDLCFLGVTASGDHERQSPYARTIGGRFYTNPQVKAYTATESDEQTFNEDQNERTRKLNVSVGFYAQNLPFYSYDDYVKNLPNQDVKLSEQQFKILEEISQDHARRGAILMGCAGSGKTLMAVTLLLASNAQVKNPTRYYFALSDKLVASSETAFCKIATCKAVDNVGGNTRAETSLKTLRENLLSMRRLSLDELQRRALECGPSQNVVDENVLAIKPSFRNATTFFSEKLGFDSRNIVRFDDFKKWYTAPDGGVDGLNAEDVWAEIRGLIKGFLGAHQRDPDAKWHWGKCTYRSVAEMCQDVAQPLGLQQRDIGAIQTLLTTHGCIKIVPSDRTNFFVWHDFSKEKERAILEENAAAGARALALQAVFSKVRSDDFSKPGLDFHEYVDLVGDWSPYEEKERKAIYSIYNRYQEWLQTNSFRDENDLARGILLEAPVENFQSDVAETIVVDECQDFSEMQLFALSKFSDKNTRFVFAGDPHQIINPTYFSAERLRFLPYIIGNGCAEHFIHDNHRSSKGIVAVANCISQKRRSVIGSFGKVYEQDEVSSVEGLDPYFLTYGEGIKNLEVPLIKVVEDPDAAVIVHSQTDREKLLSCFADEGKKRQAEALIYTIKECKGLEFKKVFCIDILGHFHDHWTQILAHGELAEHDARYRYYFNSLYVSVTRSQNGLCMMESDSATRLHAGWLGASEDRELAAENRKPPIFKSIAHGDFQVVYDAMNLKMGSPREWLIRANEALRNARNNGAETTVADFERARHFFVTAQKHHLASDDDRRNGIDGERICEIEREKKEKNFMHAIQLCVDYQMLDLLPSSEEIPTDDQTSKRDLDVASFFQRQEGVFSSLKSELIPNAVNLFSRTPEARERLVFDMSLFADLISHLAGEISQTISNPNNGVNNNAPETQD